MELSPEVKNLFLQIYRFTGGKVREFYSVRGDIKLPAQDRLPDAEPPFSTIAPALGGAFWRSQAETSRSSGGERVTINALSEAASSGCRSLLRMTARISPSGT